MFEQFQMIDWSEMPKVMATCHGTMEPRHYVSIPHILHDIGEET